MIGQNFARLEVIEHLTARKVIVKCACGNTLVAQMYKLENGSKKSCGCWFKERFALMPRGESANRYSHGHYLDKTPSKTYSSWASLKSRCLNKNSNRYDVYGGKGIKVCERWAVSFDNFLEDMGERPLNTTIDRIDNSKGYSKKNCRWASKSEQAINRKTTRFYTINGETKCLKEWSKHYDIKYLIVFKRMARGWNLMASLTKPLRITSLNRPLILVTT